MKVRKADLKHFPDWVAGQRKLPEGSSRTHRCGDGLTVSLPDFSQFVERLISEFGYTQHGLAAAVGADKNTIAYGLRLGSKWTPQVHIAVAIARLYSEVSQEEVKLL